MGACGKLQRVRGVKSNLVRCIAIALLVAAVFLVAFVLFGGGTYHVTATFENAGQLVKGNQVRVAGHTVGSVEGIDVSQDGMAEVKFSVGDDYAPLRQGTTATIKP